MPQSLFGALLASVSDAAAVAAVARDFSPRIALHPRGDVVMDLGGLTRLLGERHAIAAELRRTTADRGLRARIAMADGRTAARLLVQLVRTLRRWGVATLGAFVALPPDDMASRLGQRGVRWQRVAAGDDLEPLVPAVPEERFEQAMDLEWPIEGLEPLSFVLGRLLEPMAVHLERRDRGAAVLHIRLRLVNRAVHERSLQLPVPMRDARTLRTLLLLDLESHPPAAAIERVIVAVDPTPARVVQFSLLTRPLPSPEQLSTLMARLQALMGETRCGAPAAVDTWQPGACAMQPFAPADEKASGLGPQASGLSRPQSDLRVPSLALRRFRMPVIARVAVEEGRPVRVITDRHGIVGGRVEQCAGPWRTSGGWWTDRARPAHAHAHAHDHVLVHGGPADGGHSSWDRDEWDVTLADRVTYRIFRERDSEKWVVEGVVD